MPEERPRPSARRVVAGLALGAAAGCVALALLFLLASRTGDRRWLTGGTGVVAGFSLLLVVGLLTPPASLRFRKRHTVASQRRALFGPIGWGILAFGVPHVAFMIFDYIAWL